MKTKLFIPTKIRIGFQNRYDTFTGKLAYIIYYDEKGKIRKEKSFTSWRDHNIDVLELENKPRSGYILNKGIQRSGHWSSGRSVIRVYDDRDFEFEISVENLIGLLMYSDVSKRDIIEECIFAWSGSDLILLPINSIEYQESIEYTAKQSMKVSARDLVEGRRYSQKKSDTILTYIGYYKWHDKPNYNTCHEFIGKRHVFHNGRDFIRYQPGNLASEFDSEIDPNFSNLVEKFENSFYFQPIVEFKLDFDYTYNINDRLYMLHTTHISQMNIRRLYHNRKFPIDGYLYVKQYPWVKDEYDVESIHFDIKYKYQLKYGDIPFDEDKVVEIFKEAGYAKLIAIMEDGTEKPYIL